MPDRKSLISTLWMAASLALLVSFAVAPIRPTGFASSSIRADSDLRAFILCPGLSTACLSPAVPSDDEVMEVDALASEIEEQDGASVPGELGVSFVIPCSFRKVSDPRLIALRSILSHYPLRC